MCTTLGTCGMGLVSVVSGCAPLVAVGLFLSPVVSAGRLQDVVTQDPGPALPPLWLAGDQELRGDERRLCLRNGAEQTVIARA